jgi:hypothetical protein
MRSDHQACYYIVSEDGAQVTFFKSGVQPPDDKLVAKMSK